MRGKKKKKENNGRRVEPFSCSLLNSKTKEGIVIRKEGRKEGRGSLFLTFKQVSWVLLLRFAETNLGHWIWVWRRILS